MFMLDIKSEPASDVMRNVSIFYYYYYTMRNGGEAEEKFLGSSEKRVRPYAKDAALCVLISQ